MKKKILMLVATICVVFLCNVKVGFTQGQGMVERMDYLENRLSELTSIQNEHAGFLTEHGSIIDSVKDFHEKINVGVGVRTVYSMTEDAAGSATDGVSGGESWDKDFNLDSMRLYFNARVTDNITLEINTDVHERSVTDDNINILDAFVEYKWNDYFHVRVGRHLPASDRYNLDGPYYGNSFFFPTRFTEMAGRSSWSCRRC